MKNILVIIVLVIIAIAIFYRVNGKSKHEQVVDNSSQRTDFNEVYNLLNLPEHQLPSISISPLPKKPKNIWSSKFGGDPYWLLNTPFPVGKKTKNKLVLIAQINLSDLPINDLLPKEGILQFFISNDELMGLEFPDTDNNMDNIINNSNGYRVIYHEYVERDKSKLRKNFPKDTEFLSPVNGEYALEFKNVVQKPTPMDIYFSTLIGGSLWDFSDEDAEKLFDEFTTAGSRIGGYAYFTQSDPRFKEDADWKLLFQMDSSDTEGVDIMWGDVGVANFFIKEDSLKKKDFSKVWYNWDCH